MYMQIEEFPADIKRFYELCFVWKQGKCFLQSKYDQSKNWSTFASPITPLAYPSPWYLELRLSRYFTAMLGVWRKVLHYFFPQSWLLPFFLSSDNMTVKQSSKSLNATQIMKWHGMLLCKGKKIQLCGLFSILSN